jgi:hypothetical protein
MTIGQTLMLCPYCAEEIKDDAIVCKHCRRDFFFAKSFMQENKDLSKRLNELQWNLENLRRDVIRLGSDQRLEPNSSQYTYGSRPLMPEMRACIPHALVSIGVLLILDYVWDIRLHASLIYLRLSSLAVAVILGYNMFWKSQRYVFLSITIGAIVAILTVVGMSTEVWLARGGGTIAPENSKEWRDIAEYSASIILATLTGTLIANLVSAYNNHSGAVEDSKPSLLSVITQIIAHTVLFPILYQ